MIWPSSFKNDQRCWLWFNPSKQLRKSSYSFENLHVLSISGAMNIKSIFGKVDADDIVQLSFSHLVLSCGPEAQVSVQVMKKTGVTKFRKGPTLATARQK